MIITRLGNLQCKFSFKTYAASYVPIFSEEVWLPRELIPYLDACQGSASPYRNNNPVLLFDSV